MSMPWILRHPILRLLLGLVFIWAFAFGLTIPFLTLTARDRGVSVDAIGVIAASFLLTQIVFQVPLGALSDRVGRAGPLAAGIALFSLATVGFTQADSARRSSSCGRRRASPLPSACRPTAPSSPT